MLRKLSPARYGASVTSWLTDRACRGGLVTGPDGKTQGWVPLIGEVLGERVSRVQCKELSRSESFSGGMGSRGEDATRTSGVSVEGPPV